MKLLPEKIIDDEFKPYMTKGDTFNNQIFIRFPNNYGASVVNGPGTYGLEMMELFFDDESDDFELGGEPYGWLTEDELNNMLLQIKETGTADRERAY
ncbi:MAG: hypothetical protein EOM48_12245 [Bacilli bacterium]|nr:hypothetical protein [Bacilli bacterium]